MLYSPRSVFYGVAYNPHFLTAKIEDGTLLVHLVSLRPEWFFADIHVGADQGKVHALNEGNQSSHFVVEFMIAKSLEKM